MFRYFKHFLITALFVSHSAFAGTQEVAQAKNMYMDLLSVQTPQEDVSKLINSIATKVVGLKSDDYNKDVKADMELFLDEVKKIDLDQVIANQPISAAERPAYLRMLSTRFATLSYVFSKKIDERNSGILRSAVTPTIIKGLILTTATLFVCMSSHKIGDILQKYKIFPYILAGEYAALGVYTFIETKGKINNLKDYLKEFNVFVELNVKNIKGTLVEKTVNELE